MFTIFITHTSFQLYHCLFPRTYLQSIHTPPVPPSATTTATVQAPDTTASAAPVSPPWDSAVMDRGVTLRSTRLYDFCDVQDRGEWLDILVALIEYLRSGESKVGYLNKSLVRNMLHKSVEEEEEVDKQAGSVVVGEVVGEIPVAAGTEEMGVVSGLRRSARKRGVENSAENEEEKEERNTKVRRVE